VSIPLLVAMGPVPAFAEHLRRDHAYLAIFTGLLSEHLLMLISLAASVDQVEDCDSVVVGMVKHLTLVVIYDGALVVGWILIFTLKSAAVAFVEVLFVQTRSCVRDHR